MKNKFFYYAFTLVMLATGCAKETPNLEQDGDITGDSVIKDGYVKLELSTKKPGESKTSLSGGQVVWEADDKISVFAGDNNDENYEFSLLSSDNSSAKFQGVVLEEDAVSESFIVAYPYDADITLEGTVLSGIEVKAEQTLSSDTFASNGNPSVGFGGKTSLEFKNLCALIRIPVTGPVGVKQIVITAPEGSVLAGTGSVDVNSEDLALTISEGAANVITLTASEPVDATGGVNFYAVVLPQGPDFACEITVTLEDGSSMTKKFEDANVLRARARSSEEFVAYDTPVFYGSANCYIGKPGVDIEFDVTPYYMSSYETCSPTTIVPFTKAIADAVVVWKEDGLTGNLTAVYENGKVKVSGIDGKGNALVAIRAADETILWSYHIWVPVDDPTQTHIYEMHSSQTEKTREVMPMNLGALTTTGNDAFGCYYQRGRKDPLGRLNPAATKFVECGVSWNSLAQGLTISYFYNPAEANYGQYGTGKKAAVLYSIQNPTVFLRADAGYSILGEESTVGLWGNNSTEENQTYTKSVFDPCPAGYRVMQKGTLLTFIGNDALTGGKETHSTNNRIANSGKVGAELGFKFYYNTAGDSAHYPLTGVIINGTGNLANITSKENAWQGGIWYSTGAKDSTNDNIYGLSFTYYPRTTSMDIHNQNHGSAGKNVRCVKE